MFRCIKCTENVGLLYKILGEFETCSGANFAGDNNTRKSTSRVLCKYGNATIPWKNENQQCVALSTTEAEYGSAATVAKAII